MEKINEKLQQVLEISIALTAEKNPDSLLDLIIQTAMDLTNSDAGTLYVVKDDYLYFRNMKTRSKGIDLGKNGEKIELPPVPLLPENICAYAAIQKKPLDIEDVYKSDLFDFSGPKRYDEINGYHSKSMVAIPMLDKEDEVIGVMQLINAMDEAGQIRSFLQEEIRILMALASQTAIAIANMAYLEEIQEQMWSFTAAMTEAIDARTPYNGNHTRQVAKYAGYLVDYMNQLYEQGKEECFFSKEHKDQIVLAAFLHDIGKMVVPIEVMNKQTRLERYQTQIENRLEKISLLLEIDFLKGDLPKACYESELAKVNQCLALIGKVNQAGFLSDELLSEIEAVSAYCYLGKETDSSISYFTKEELACMRIRKGTLTEGERKEMESHVVMTERILRKVHFNHAFEKAPIWASQHHECLNGTGYPRGLKEEEIGIEARILAVADICDALLATDRPYKKPMEKAQAFVIMEDMASKGQIDAKLVSYLKICLS